MKNKLFLFLLGAILSFTFFFPVKATGQTSFCRDSVLNAAREIIQGAPYCALVTIDSTGQPQVRTMNPFPLGGEFVIWFGTSRYSAKVKELSHNPNVSVYYADHVKGNGYVSVVGKAEVMDDKELLVKMKRDYWGDIPGWKELFVLIRVVPQKLEVINYKHGMVNDPKTFKAPTVTF